MPAPDFCLSCAKKRKPQGRCERCGFEASQALWQQQPSMLSRQARNRLLLVCVLGSLSLLGGGAAALRLLSTQYTLSGVLGALLCLVGGVLLLQISLVGLLQRTWRARSQDGTWRAELTESHGFSVRGYALQRQQSEWSPEIFGGFVFWNSARIASHTDSLWRVFAQKLSPASEDTETALRDVRFLLLGTLLGLLARDVVRLLREEELAAWQLGDTPRPLARGFLLRFGQNKSTDELWLERSLLSILDEEWKREISRNEENPGDLLRDGVPLVALLQALVQKCALWNGEPTHWQKRQRFVAATQPTSFEHWRLVDDIDEFLQERRTFVESLLLQIERALSPLLGEQAQREVRRQKLQQG